MIDKEALFSSSMSIVEKVLNAEYGSYPFMVLGGIGLVSVFLFGTLLAKWVGSSQRGFILCGIGLLLPLVIGVFGHGVAGQYLKDFFEDPELLKNLMLASAVFTGVFTLLFISPFFLGTGFFKTAVVFVLTMVVTGLALYYSDMGLSQHYQGTKKWEKQPIVLPSPELAKK